MKDENNLNKDKIKKKKAKIKSNNTWAWPLKIFILALSLSLLFSVLSEFVLSSTGIVLAVFIIIFLILFGALFDMIGVAVTAATAEPFRAMAAKKVRGSKESLMLLRNADKVGSLCNDVVGDVCGIISGACGASIVVKIALTGGSPLQIIVASSISAIIAGLTILAKALGKKYAITNANKLVHAVGKCLSIFSRQKKIRKSKVKKEENILEENDAQMVDKQN